jgi:hypothetical protein
MDGFLPKPLDREKLASLLAGYHVKADIAA